MAVPTSKTVAVIGCGTLGTAIATGMLDPLDKSSTGVKRLIATVGTEASKRRVEEAFAAHSSRLTVLLQQDNLRAIQEADAVLFSVKPVMRAKVFGTPGVKEALRGKLILSIMAGITTAEVRRLVLGEEDDSAEPLQVVRTMPNMAARIREGMALCAANMETLTKENVEFATWVYTQVGQCQFMAESSFDISSVLVGCAGSLLLLAVDGLLDAAVAEGVKRAEATKFVMNSALGMMKLVPSGEHPSVLREKISSPGGCSIRALLELERQGVRSAFTTAIMKAAERSKAMSNLR